MYNFGGALCLDCSIAFMKRGSYHLRCDTCSIINNRKKNSKKALKYYHADKKKYSKWNKESRGKNIEAYILRRARGTAIKRGHDFNIEKSDIIIPEYCPYLEMKITPTEFNVDSCPSIDRIDSSKGYVKGNIQIISYKANKMKSNASEEELKTFARNILAKL